MEIFRRMLLTVLAEISRAPLASFIVLGAAYCADQVIDPSGLAPVVLKFAMIGTVGFFVLRMILLCAGIAVSPVPANRAASRTLR